MVSSSSVKELSDVKEFENYTSSEHRVLYMYADWVPSCQHISTVYNEVAKNKQEMILVNVNQANVDKVPLLAEKLQVEIVPFFAILNTEDELISKVEGSNISELNNMIKKFSEGKIVSKEEQKVEKLKKLINQNEVMVFIKGTAENPKCGFTRQLLNLLNEKKVKYGFFDILSDEEVRQGLKEYSDWPTYPQVYVKGEFVGGLDIVKEMAESEDFYKTFPAEKDLNTYLIELVQRHKFMIFIKGTPKQPQCGFTRQLLRLIEENEIDFDYFDILSDERVRQGLKEYSDWATYPQIYYKGEFIGGLDIFKEMIEAKQVNFRE